MKVTATISAGRKKTVEIITAVIIVASKNFPAITTRGLSIHSHGTVAAIQWKTVSVITEMKITEPVMASRIHGDAAARIPAKEIMAMRIPVTPTITAHPIRVTRVAAVTEGAVMKMKILMEAVMDIIVTTRNHRMAADASKTAIMETTAMTVMKKITITETADTIPITTAVALIPSTTPAIVVT